MFRELQEYVFGQKPIRRQNPTLGQSEWYYMDPRGTDNFSDMKTIDVANSESPNPYAAEIKADLYKNDPTNYKLLFGNSSEEQMTTIPRTKYQAGALSREFESSGNPAAIGIDNAGGPSYGAYQIATIPGTMKEYLNYLKNSKNLTYKNYADILNSAGGNEAAQQRTQGFVDAWKNLAQNPEFESSQYNFISDTHLKPVLNKTEYPEILKLEYRHPVIRDALYSMSVQHGKASEIINKALKELKDNYGTEVTDELLLKRLYESRKNYVASLPESQFKGDRKITKTEKDTIINNRYPAELKKALNFLKTTSY